MIDLRFRIYVRAAERRNRDDPPATILLLETLDWPAAPALLELELPVDQVGNGALEKDELAAALVWRTLCRALRHKVTLHRSGA